MESDAFYTCTPMFHVLGILLGTMAPLCAGARIVIVRKFSPSTFWDDCREHDVTAFGAVFAMISMLLSRPVSPSDTNHSVRAIFSAGVGATQQEEFENRFGAQLLEGYGLTEGGMLTYMPREHPRHGSCGKPLSESYIVEIHDDADNPVKADEPGEIVARPIVPGTIMSGYWRMPEETVDIFRNLWLHTGDTGRMDSDGYLYFVDRKKDVIRRRGKNISSFSIESALLKHAAVGEVSAYPVPSRLGEDDVMVAVVPVAGSTPTFEELASYAAHVLPAYAVPTYIRFMAELPKTPSSKVRKNVLRKEGITADAWSSPARALAH
jgi:crotonobetaine/carnitine-CoA ligase